MSSKYQRHRENNPEYRAREALRKKRARARKKDEFTSDVEKLSGTSSPQSSKQQLEERGSLVVVYNRTAPELAIEKELPESLSARSCVAKVRRLVYEWTKEWGPVDFWAYRLRASLEVAKEGGDDGTSQWSREAHDLLYFGRRIQKELAAVSVLELPKEHWEITDIWRQAFDLMGQLQLGISLLEAHLEFSCLKEVLFFP